MEQGNDSVVIPYVHIINLRTKQGTITDADGIFLLSSYKGDTLEFSSIGYQNHTYIIDSSAILKIELKIDTQVLPAQTIRPLPKSLNDLRQAINNLEIRDANDSMIANMEKAGFKVPPVNPTKPKNASFNGGFSFSPLSLFYEKVVKKIQEKKKKKAVLQEMPKME